MYNWRDKMDIQSPEEDYQQFEVLSRKDDKKLVLSTEAQRVALSILNKRNRVVQLNRMIDNNNSASLYKLSLQTKQLRRFKHFLTRNKFRSQRAQIFNAVRQLAQSKNYVLSGRVNMKQEKSKMVLRVISKEDLGLVVVEDQTGKQKMIVKYGTVWVGMIALMQVTWIDNSYRLDEVLDLSPHFQKRPTEIRMPNNAYRILFVKGSFMNHESKDNTGLKILLDQIRHLLYSEKTRVSCLVIMGPLLHKKNKALTGYMQNTFEHLIEEVTQLIRVEIDKISSEIQIIFVPSTDDITHLYPIPQPKYLHFKHFTSSTTHFTSNPGLINLSGKQNIKIDVLNTDILSYIDNNRAGRPKVEIMQQNLETYFKQPFYLTNSTDQPFDQINIPSLYNFANFGDIIVTSSIKSPPFAKQVRGKVFLNIGCLNMQQGDENTKHYMTLVSIFEGTGHISGRTKVERLEM